MIRIAAFSLVFAFSQICTSASVAQTTDNRAVAPVVAATRPVLAISFLAGTTESGMRALNRSLKAFKPKKKTILMAFANEQPMPNPAAWTIPKTIFWVTPIYRQLTKELGEGAVILNPLIADADDNGETILRSANDLSGVAVEVYFQAYQYPGYNGTTNTIGPRSEGAQITPMTMVLPNRERAGQVRTFASITDAIPQKAMSSYAQEWLSGSEFQKLMDVGVENLPEQDKVTRKVVKKIRAEAAALGAADDAGNQLNWYSSVVGLPNNSVLPEFLAAETRFRAIQSKRFVHYIWNSPLGDSLQELLLAEQKGHKALDTAWLTAGLAGAKGSGSSMLSSLMNAQPRMASMGQDITAATYPVLSEQVRITSILSESSASIEAKSLDDLRKKFKELSMKMKR